LIIDRTMATEDTKETTPIDFQQEFKQASEKVTTEFASALSALSSSFPLRPQEEKDDGECCFMYADDDTANQIGKISKESAPEAKDGNLISQGQQTPPKSRDNKSPYTRSSPMARMRDTEEQNSSALKEKASPSKPSRKPEDIKKSWTRRFKKAQKEKKLEQMSLDEDGSAEADPATTDSIISEAEPSIQRTASGGKGDMGLLDPLFNAAMVLSEIPQMKSDDFFTLLQGNCGVGEDGSSEDSGSFYSENENDSRSLESYPSKRTPPRVKSVKKQETQKRPKKTQQNTDFNTLPKKKTTPKKKSKTIPSVSPKSRSPQPASSPPKRAKAKDLPVDPKNKNFIKGFIQDMELCGCRMFWYKDKSSSPLSVVLFLMNGHQTETSEYAGPALVWADEKERDQFYGVNLFDIRSIDRTTSLTLGGRKTEHVRRCILIRLSKGNDFVFEAESEDEAFRFIHGMKWMIARFSFNLILGNVDVSCEVLDVGHVTARSDSNSPKSLLEEAEAAKAVDDVTMQMLDRCIYI